VEPLLWKKDRPTPIKTKGKPYSNEWGFLFEMVIKALRGYHIDLRGFETDQRELTDKWR
jgi:hypothetical protein